MKKRILVSIIMLVALVAAFAFRLIDIYGAYIFDLFIGALCIFCSLEFSKLLSKMEKPVSQLASGLYPSFMFAGHMFFFVFDLKIYYYAIIQLSILIFAFLVTFLVYLFLNTKDVLLYIKEKKLSRFKFALTISFNSLLTFIYPSLFLLCLMILNRIDMFDSKSIALFAGNLGWIVLTIAFLIPILTDTFAMLGGRALKGPKLCKKISPNKTISGSVVSVLLTSLVVGALYFCFTAITPIASAVKNSNINLWSLIAVGFVGSIVCQLGDLFESFLKRKANVKDSGNVFPGHGGFLDRLDSHIFNAPFVLIFTILTIII